MKKILLFSLIVMSGLFFSCNDSNNPVTNDGKGKIYVSSDPQGATIYVDDVNTGGITPDTVEAKEGLRKVTLKKAGYTDYTFDVSVEAGKVSVVSNITLTSLGSISVTSDPVGAQIWLNGSNTNFVSPKVISSLAAGSYQLTLKYSNHRDTTVTVNVTHGNQAVVNVSLTPLYEKYSNIKLYETIGTTSDQPSGLDLSRGLGLSVSVSPAKDSVDIYYSSDGFLVKSASSSTSMTRNTYFKVGSASNLNDGIDSPTKDNSWTSSMGDRETNYVFLYDQDGHYTKIKIVGYGGGTPGVPAYVVVDLIYNKAKNSRKF
ncbi:MAG: hypothetical protein Fur0015_12240 [Ignavibacteriales bacterium]